MFMAIRLGGVLEMSKKSEKRILRILHPELEIEGRFELLQSKQSVW